MSPGPTPLSRAPQPLSFERERLRMILMGDSGAGKTYFGAHAPRPVFIDTDGGLVTASVQGRKPLALEPTGYKELEGLYWWMKEHQGDFDTIVWDSITTGQRLLIDEIHDAGLATGKDVKPVMQWVPEISEYQAVQRQLARILTDLRRLGKHIILIAGVKERMGKRSPDVSPGVLSVLVHWSSIIGELVVLTRDSKGEMLPQPRRVLFTGPDSTRETKSRFASVVPYVPDPTFDEVWKRVQSEYTEAEARSKAKTNREESA